MKAPVYAIASVFFLLAACGGDDSGTSNDSITGNDDDDDDEGGSFARGVDRDDIVSNRSGAERTDSDLVNAWGLAFNPLGVAWVSANGIGVSEVYDEDGQHVIDPVVIPAPAGSSDPSAPTGQVFNGKDDAFDGDRFIFVTEDGVIAGWQPVDGSEATMRLDKSQDEAIYKGVTIVDDANGNPRLFAADFHNRRIDVFDASYESLTTSGNFEDSQIPDDFAPFNVEAMNRALIVTYAKQDDAGEDDVARLGNGYVNMFDVDGGLMARLITQGGLNSPWGVAIAPHDFTAAPDRLLIGNFGDGLIHTYRLSTSNSGEMRAESDGALLDPNGNELAIDGLWALKFGPGAGDFDSDDLYFTAGPNEEADGVFGQLESESDD